MSPRTATQQKWILASLVLTDAYTDFILSRQAMQCTPATLDFYKYTAGVFLKWVEGQSVISPEQVDSRIVRQYLAELTGQGKADKTLHAHARAIRTLLRFWYAEHYIPSPVSFAMPRMEKKRLPCLTAEQLNTVLSACKRPRDKALVLFMADSGLRRAEIININWDDFDIMSGLVRVRRGKGGKSRSAVIGATARRSLLAYRRTLGSPANDSSVFQSRNGGRFTGPGFLQIFRRISRQAGIHVTSHALRRTFVILSLRAGMDVLHLQSMLGHASLDMVQHYAQMVDDDLLQAHKAHSPIDNLAHLR
ncbi:MAG: tyrosine-type recombinase/integrase [Anaerolineales bacterium]|jgi:integrase/recombinase XerD